MSRRNYSPELKAAALKILSAEEILSSSHFGALLVRAGVVTVRKRKGRLSSRGAGFVGGALLAALRREGLISLWRDEGLTRAWLTRDGQRHLKENAAPLQVSAEAESGKIRP